MSVPCTELTSLLSWRSAVGTEQTSYVAEDVSRSLFTRCWHFTQPLCIDELAEQVQMSTPSFHNHFRRLTSMSPLQYQKPLRLHKAKRLMINQHYSASCAAFEVGYESPSQFNREYSRMFGNPPRRDIQKGHHSKGWFVQLCILHSKVRYWHRVAW